MVYLSSDIIADYLQVIAAIELTMVGNDSKGQEVTIVTVRPDRGWLLAFWLNFLFNASLTNFLTSLTE
jgi:hypothetical protein